MHRATSGEHPLNTPAAPAGSFRIRQASRDDFQALLDFYAGNKSAALPIPTVKVVGDTIEQGRILVVQPSGEERIVASAAVFQLTPQSALTYTGELAGRHEFPHCDRQERQRAKYRQHRSDRHEAVRRAPRLDAVRRAVLARQDRRR